MKIGYLHIKNKRIRFINNAENFSYPYTDSNLPIGYQKEDVSREEAFSVN